MVCGEAFRTRGVGKEEYETRAPSPPPIKRREGGRGRGGRERNREKLEWRGGKDNIKKIDNDNASCFMPLSYKTLLIHILFIELRIRQVPLHHYVSGP